MTTNDTPFWQRDLDTLTPKEWEMLCDGCAKCCLHKLEDEDDGDVYYTDIVCNYIDIQTCRCSDYHNRHINVPNCIAFSAKDISKMKWLPDTCAYKLRAQGEPLYDWHYLISGDPMTIHQAEESILNFAEIDCGQDLEEHVIYFKP